MGGRLRGERDRGEPGPTPADTRRLGEPVKTPPLPALRPDSALWRDASSPGFYEEAVRLLHRGLLVCLVDQSMHTSSSSSADVPIKKEIASSLNALLYNVHIRLSRRGATLRGTVAGMPTRR